MINPKKDQDLINLVEFDSNNEHCTDKIDTISICHNTGHITLYTKKNKEIHTTLSNLIHELNIEHSEIIVKKEQNIFENVLTIKYPKQRRSEYLKILRGALLVSLEEKKDFLDVITTTVQVNELVNATIKSDLENQVLAGFDRIK